MPGQALHDCGRYDLPVDWNDESGAVHQSQRIFAAPGACHRSGRTEYKRLTILAE